MTICVPDVWWLVQNEKLVDNLKEAVANANSLAARETGLAAIAAVCKDVGASASPFLTPLLPEMLTAYADKVRVVVCLSGLSSQYSVPQHNAPVVSLRP